MKNRINMHTKSDFNKVNIKLPPQIEDHAK